MVPRHRTNRQKPRPARLFTCVLLCFVMWRGPVPWIHHHAEEASDGLVDAALSRHLAAYHHDGLGILHTSAWHFHFLLPWTAGDTDDDGTSGSHDPVIAGRLLLPDPPVTATFVDHCRSVDLPAVTVPLVERPTAEMPPQELNVAASFIGSLLSTAPVCALFGVALN